MCQLTRIQFETHKPAIYSDSLPVVPVIYNAWRWSRSSLSIVAKLRLVVGRSELEEKRKVKAFKGSVEFQL
ncbi:hypothetical protein K2173_007662 [Erythroxylum novogranatense]|uniref:Uncharacterized protein n=1 Tax=Erythroxylum novogranatense TaxID=1862640 RepID=A0AAV8TSC0_9ROSI|nr:hypothetical protein K2173_007662 [Erythroxylum novogranatense]